MEFNMSDNLGLTSARYRADDARNLNYVPDFMGQGLQIALPLRTKYQRSSIRRASKHPTTPVATPAPSRDSTVPPLHVQCGEDRAVEAELDEFMNQVSTSIEEKQAAEEALAAKKKQALEATQACHEKIKARKLALQKANDEANRKKLHAFEEERAKNLALQAIKDEVNRRQHAVEEEHAKHLALQAAKDGVNRPQRAAEQEPVIKEERTTKRKRTREEQTAHAAERKWRRYEKKLARWKEKQNKKRAYEEYEDEVIKEENEAEDERSTREYRPRKKQRAMGEKQANPDEHVMFTVKEALAFYKMNEQAGFPLNIPLARTKLD